MLLKQRRDDVPLLVFSLDKTQPVEDQTYSGEGLGHLPDNQRHRMEAADDKHANVPPQR